MGLLEDVLEELNEDTESGTKTDENSQTKKTSESGAGEKHVFSYGPAFNEEYGKKTKKE